MQLPADSYDKLLIFVVRAKDTKLYSTAEFLRFAGVLKMLVVIRSGEELSRHDMSWAHRLKGDFRRYAKMTTQELTAMAATASRAGTEMPAIVGVYEIHNDTLDSLPRFVVRRGDVLLSDTGATYLDVCPVALCGDIKEARRVVPVGRVRIPRHDNDPPSLVERWL